MAKMQMSTSQMQAVCRNRNVQKNLTEKLEQLDQVAFQSKDAIHQEMKTWRKFHRENIKNSGWSPKSLRPEPGEDVFFPSSGRSNTPNLPNQGKEAFTKPWAYTYSQGSHNKTYKELAHASQSSQKVLDLSLKTSSSPIIANACDNVNKAGDQPAMLKHVAAFQGLNRAASFLKPKEKLLALRQRQDTKYVKKTETDDENTSPGTIDETTFASAVTKLQKINKFNTGCKSSKSENGNDPEQSPSKKLARSMSAVKGMTKFRHFATCSKCGGDTDIGEQGERFAKVAITYKGLHRAQSVLKLQSLHTEEDVHPETLDEKSRVRRCSCNCQEKHRPISQIWKESKEVVDKLPGDDRKARQKTPGVKHRPRLVSGGPIRSSVSNLNEAKVRQIQVVKEKISKCFELNSDDQENNTLIGTPQMNESDALLVKSNVTDQQSSIALEPQNHNASDNGEKLPLQSKDTNDNKQSKRLSQAVDILKTKRGTLSRSEFKHNLAQKQRTIQSTITEESSLTGQGKDNEGLNVPNSDAKSKCLQGANRSVSAKGLDRVRKTSTNKKSISNTNGQSNKNDRDMKSDPSAYISSVEDATGNGIEINDKACTTQDTTEEGQHINEVVIKQIQEKVFREFGKNLRQNCSPMLRKFSAVSKASTMFQVGGHRRKKGSKTSGVNVFTRIAKYMLFRMWQRRREKEKVEKREENTCYGNTKQTAHYTNCESLFPTHYRANSCEGDDSPFDSIGEICMQNVTYRDRLTMMKGIHSEGGLDLTQQSDEIGGNNSSVKDFVTQSNCHTMASLSTAVSNRSRQEETSNSNLRNSNTHVTDRVSTNKNNIAVHNNNDTNGNRRFLTGRDTRINDGRNNTTNHCNHDNGGNINRNQHENDNDNNNNYNYNSNSNNNNRCSNTTTATTTNNNEIDNTMKSMDQRNPSTSLLSPSSDSTTNGNATKSDKDASKVVLPGHVYHKGVRLFNYVSPEKRYLSSKQAKVRKDLSVRWHSAVGAMVNKHEISDEPSLAEKTFPKQARDRALNKMIEANHTSPPDDTLKLQNEALRTRIQDFLDSVKPYKQK